MRKFIVIALAMLSTMLSTTTVFAAAPGSAATAPVYTKAAFGIDVSDLWWNPSESGWGMQLVQEADFVFATVYVYGPNGSPTWITGELVANGGGVFSGPLYVTSGPWFGGPFDPTAVGTRQAGTMTFTLQTAGTGTLTYSVDGVQVTKEVQRETLVLDDYTGDYFSSAKLQSSGCSDPTQDGVMVAAVSMNINQTTTNMSMVWAFNSGNVCTYSGAYGQAGHLGTFVGGFSCTNGDAGQMLLYEMTYRPGTISGQLSGSGSNTGCQYTGNFSGIDPNYSPQ
ncbi:MAG: hypothetical protein ACYC9Z_14215 [Casimicrobiaceae bacterium]